MALTWPASLPQSFLVNGLTEEGPDNVIRSPVDTGPAKTRRRYTATVRPITGRMLMSVTQYATFKTFYRDTIFDGALEFDMPDDIDGGTMTVKFKDKFTSNTIGQKWIINMNLNKQP